MSGWDRLLDLLFPPKCPFCGCVLDTADVCPACRKTLPWTEEDRREQTLPGGLRCASPLWYEEAARQGILRFKFGGASGAARALGGLMAECAAERFSGEFDTVTWVPVSGKRLKKRGYDQSRLLAEAACRRWEMRPEPLLKKERDNPAQSGLTDAAARRANVLGVYTADAAGTDGKRVLLIDDITTTGATLCECARELTAAGAQSVLALTLARTREKKENRAADERDCAACKNT